MNNPTVNASAALDHPSLLVMLKAPENAKRRLAAEVGDLAGEAAVHLLACALEDARSWSGPTWLSPASQRDWDWLLSEIDAELAPAQPSCSSSTGTTSPHDADTTTHCGKIFGLIPQRGGNLGERINYVDSELRRRGVGRLIFVGTDCPGLDSAYLEQAASSLRTADAVLGPAGDGGVVLMGARRPWPDLKGLGWSTQDLCGELRNLCLDDGWNVATLDIREDVDTLGDLLGAGALLMGDERLSRRGLAKWLSAHRGALSAQHPDGADETHLETTS